MIGVCAPSSYVTPETLEKGIAALEAKGFKVRLHPQTFARLHQSAGTAAEKVAALHELFADPSIRAVWAAGGGNRALDLLERLDWDLIRANPKPFVGFSDATALLNAIAARAGFPAVHGPVLSRVEAGPELDALLDILAGRVVSLPMSGVRIFRNGVARGPMLGGNLALTLCLAGTRDFLPCEGAILFLEDIGEETSRIDRAFIQLARLGVFQSISGLVLGAFSDLKDTGRPFGFTMDEIVAESLEGREIPIITNAPFGHRGPLYPLPVGGWARLEASEAGCRLSCATDQAAFGSP